MSDPIELPTTPSSAVETLYKLGWTTRRIANTLKLSRYNVAMIIHGSSSVEMRGRGGPNHQSKLASTLFALSYDELHATSVHDLARRYDVHVTTVYKARAAARANRNRKDTNDPTTTPSGA